MNTDKTLGAFLEKAKYKPIAEINSNDLDRLIENYFSNALGIELPDFEMVCFEEWNNDTNHSFILTKKPKYHWQHKQRFEFIAYLNKEKKWPSFPTRQALDIMAQDGALPECELVVKVSW